jgi:hypothetical protein
MLFISRFVIRLYFRLSYFVLVPVFIMYFVRCVMSARGWRTSFLVSGPVIRFLTVLVSLSRWMS